MKNLEPIRYTGVLLVLSKKWQELHAAIEEDDMGASGLESIALGMLYFADNWSEKNRLAAGRKRLESRGVFINATHEAVSDEVYEQLNACAEHPGILPCHALCWRLAAALLRLDEEELSDRATEVLEGIRSGSDRSRIQYLHLFWMASSLDFVIDPEVSCFELLLNVEQKLSGTEYDFALLYRLCDDEASFWERVESFEPYVGFGDRRPRVEARIKEVRDRGTSWLEQVGRDMEHSAFCALAYEYTRSCSRSSL